MAGIDWGLAQTDPIAQQARGFSYADKIAQSAATQQAGQKFATGDYKGAVSDLASSGNIPEAMQVQQVQQQQTDRGVKSAEGVRDYVSKALPIFQHIAEVHAGDPDGGSGAIGQAFDHIAPELSQLTGHDDKTVAQMRQQLVSDPKGTLDRLQAQIPATYEKVGNTIVRRQGDTVKPVYTGTPTPPEGFNYQPDGKTLAPIPGGPGDPEYKKKNAENNRAVIINNPLPGQGPGGLIASSDPVVSSWVGNVLNGNATMQQVPARYKNSVSVAIQGADKDAYSPTASSRLTLASSRITAPYTNMASYKLTSDGLPYLERIDAAFKHPGSVGDQDMLDSLTKLNTGGNAVTDAQISLITNHKSFSDWASVLRQKFQNGGALSPNQRQQIKDIANDIFANYRKGYQPVYEQATKQLKDAGIPEPFWTIPDLNKLNAGQSQVGGGGASSGGWGMATVVKP